MRNVHMLPAIVLNYVVFSTFGCGLDKAGTGLGVGCGGPPFTADSGEGGQDSGMDSSNSNDANNDGAVNDAGMMDSSDAAMMQDAQTQDASDAAPVNEAGNDADSGPGCSTTGSWSYEPDTSDGGTSCYTAFLVNGNTCVSPPASTPDGVCETVQCANSPSSGENVFIWTADTQTVIDAPNGKIGQVVYMVVPSQPTCNDMAALIPSSNWRLATVNQNGTQNTFTAPGANGQPRAYWVTAL